MPVASGRECGVRSGECGVEVRLPTPHSALRTGHGGWRSMSLVDRVRALLGDDAVDVAATPDGVPRVAPGSPDAVGLLLGTAREEGWRVRIEGAGTWLPLDPPGLAGRTLGSVVATATAGPLRQGFGAVRDHLLGVTFVTGDGRLG